MTTAIYDGMCVICNQTRRTVKALDWFNRVEFLDLHKWSQVEARYPTLRFEDAMGQIHVVDEDGTLIGGFFGVRRMLRDLPLGYPLWLILHLPGMDWLGQKAYRFIARNRYRINKFFGVDICDNGVCKIPS